MDRQNAGLGAILVAFLGAVFLASASRTGPPPATDTAAASRNSLARAVAKHAFPEHTGIDMIMDFLDADTEQTVLKFPWSSKEPWPTEDSSWPKADPRGSYKTGYIIATLPDPSEPPLSDRFDSRLEAIQRAAAEDGYALDTVDLPWAYPEAGNSTRFKLGEAFDIQARQEPRWDPSETPRPTAAASSAPGSAKASVQPIPESPPTSYVAVTPRADRSSQYPGLMLFRNKDKSLLLLVYVVSETPTSGINKTQLREAFDEVAWLSGWTTRPTPKYLPPLDHTQDALRILGPSTAGSVSSLRFTIRSWLDYAGSSKLFKPGHDVKIRIVSGSSTGLKKKDFPELKDSSAPFGSTVAPFSPKAISYALCQAVSDNGEQKAFFTETNTAYGAEAIPPKTQVTAPNAVMINHTPGVFLVFLRMIRSVVKPSCGDGNEYTLVRFPLHIASLRAAARNDPTQDISKTLQLGPSNIPLSVYEGEAGYLARPYSPRSAIYDDLSLSRAIGELSKQGVKYVGIVASDSADRLFLVHRIHAEMPNATIVLLTSDLLYLHSDFASDTYGALIVSTYSLFGANQLWSYPFQGNENPEYFQNETAEGVFNATLALLSDYQSGDLRGCGFRLWATTAYGHSPFSRLSDWQS
jgi:hypothetical protein